MNSVKKPQMGQISQRQILEDGTGDGMCIIYRTEIMAERFVWLTEYLGLMVILVAKSYLIYFPKLGY